MAKQAQRSQRLELWQRRLADAERGFQSETEKMDGRERLYRGDPALFPLTPGEPIPEGMPRRTSHVRNVIFENIESQVSTSIPQPKVTPVREQDERLAAVIEHFLRNELDRMPFEMINDLLERVVPIHGGAGLWVEWDDSRGTGGEITVTALHPKQLAPQPGVFGGIEEMDWFILKLPSTKEAVRRRYGVNVEEEGESEPDVRGAGADPAQDAVTEYIGYERGKEGGIDRFCWVNDVVLEDLPDYQARRVRGQDGTMRTLEEDEVGFPPERVPFYKPNRYPVILQRNVSAYGQLLGSSDVDTVESLQNTINWLEWKIKTRLMDAGSMITLPDRADIRIDQKDFKKVYIGSASDKQLIDIYEFSGDLEYYLTYLEYVYQETRQILGITDSFQGRKDTTATSGKAKEFSAAQSAGRLESKRVMKNAAYSALFERMFQLALAYADSPRPVYYKDPDGNTRYEQFNRYDFLERDELGQLTWNDRFLFSCDSTAPLATNREAMWQETAANLKNGAFGDPTQTETLILYWSKMEALHYPTAGETKTFLESKLERERQQAMAAQQQAQAQQQVQRQGRQSAQAQAAQAQAAQAQTLQAVDARAREDAARAVGANL